MIFLWIIIVIILLIYFSTIKLKVENLIFSNNFNHKQSVVKLQIFVFNKIKIAEIKLKNNKIKKEYIGYCLRKILRKEDIKFFKNGIKNFKLIKIKIEKFNYKFNILFGEGIVYHIEVDFKISLKVRNLVLQNV